MLLNKILSNLSNMLLPIRIRFFLSFLLKFRDFHIRCWQDPGLLDMLIQCILSKRIICNFNVIRRLLLLKKCSMCIHNNNCSFFDRFVTLECYHITFFVNCFWYFFHPLHISISLRLDIYIIDL